MNLKISKNRFILLPVIVLVGVTASLLVPPDRIERTWPEVSVRHEVLYRNARPYSGILVERYENGALYRESAYRNGIREGVTREFALNRRIQAILHYARGVPEGTQRGWYAEGPRKFEYHYRDGHLEGTQTDWHLNGAVFRSERFTDGQETDRKILYPDGSVFTNYSKREGRTYGFDGGALCMGTKRPGEK